MDSGQAGVCHLAPGVVLGPAALLMHICIPVAATCLCNSCWPLGQGPWVLWGMGTVGRGRPGLLV